MDKGETFTLLIDGITPLAPFPPDIPGATVEPIGRNRPFPHIKGTIPPGGAEESAISPQVKLGAPIAQGFTGQLSLGRP